MSTAQLGWRRFSTHGQIIIIFELVSIFGNFCKFSPHRNLDCWCRLNWSSDGGHCAAAMLLFAEYWPSEAAEMGEDFILTFEKRRRSIRCFFKHFLLLASVATVSGCYLRSSWGKSLKRNLFGGACHLRGRAGGGWIPINQDWKLFCSSCHRCLRPHLLFHFIFLKV